MRCSPTPRSRVARGLLGAGLDTRAQRLTWPPGTTAHEVDRAALHRCKDRVLDGAVAAPGPRTAGRVPVVAAVTRRPRRCAARGGPGPAVPSVWVAEGLLLSLSGAQNDHRVAELARLVAGSILSLTPSGQHVHDDADAERE